MLAALQNVVLSPQLTLSLNNQLQQSVTVLRGVGPQLAAKLDKLGLTSVQDLLFHLPLRYSDQTQMTPIGNLQLQQQVVVEGEIMTADIVIGRRRSLLCRLRDNTGFINIRFYRFTAAQKAKFVPGCRLRCVGEVRRGASGLEIYHPDYEISHPSAVLKPLPQTLTPIYSSTEGVSQKQLRRLIDQSLALIDSDNLLDLLPASSDKAMSLKDVLHYLHKPPKTAVIALLAAGEHPLQQRLITEELVAYQLSMLKVRRHYQSLQITKLKLDKSLAQQFVSSLPFQLTTAQQRVSAEIYSDLNCSKPMMRLVQGDVGSGKTLVAALAALQAIANGTQVAILAPTDILAEQHRQNFQQWFASMNITIGLLSGRQKASVRRAQMSSIASGESQLVIGTHALFQEQVEFHSLALVIIDEQHRFGVHQRLSLRNKGQSPHQLIMTATPIPRSLAMSLYADLDYSVIDELPRGRIPIETAVISQKRRLEVIDRIRHACLQGRQAYWVCTLIETSESLTAEAAEETFDKLRQLLPELSIDLIHGRLKAPEKERAMEDFKTGVTQLLIATTVIEVGVDIPNASLMIIENPERLGLAQLHQLRGRIGRGNTASYCILLYGDELSHHSKQRLQAMRSTNDGFRIAEFDLQLRGPGEMLGTRQTGDIRFKLANLQRDAALMDHVKHLAQQIVSEYPQRVEPLIQRWLGKHKDYASV